MNSKTKIVLLFALIFFVALFFMWRSPKNNSKTSVNATNSDETMTTPEKNSGIEQKNLKNNLSPSIKTDTNTLKNLPTPEADAGLIKIPYMQTESGQKFIRVKIEKQPVCHPGDFEAMTKGVGKNGDLLISLEPLGGEGSRIQKSVSMADIESGITFDLPVNQIKSPVYGIFLCEDSSGLKTCLGKPAANFNAIIGNPNANDSGKNVVYFFQFSYLQPENHLLYTGPAIGIGSVRDYVRDHGGTKASDSQLLKVKKLIRGVNSLPAKVTFNDHEVRITLPIAANIQHLCANPGR